MKKIFVLSLVSLLVLSSCKKKEDPCVTNTASIAGTYKLTSLRFKPSGGTESEIISSLPTCRRDDLHVLNANGNYNYQDAGVVCVPNGNLVGSWSLTGNTIDLEGNTGTIQSFDCTTLVFYKNDFPAAGDKTTSVFVRQ
ncbi:MAG: hypothetical protein IPP43_03130 [Chitinophagaceae bacterium]|nr:hypothetical protein [Chitinophagaceae bacterium]MBK9569062.1 hypothetical protein [Chitinophagaceae bacterium]MBL0130231.1 hypothetical protein [Chitinophagaceae bacterium]